MSSQEQANGQRSPSSLQDENEGALSPPRKRQKRSPHAAASPNVPVTKKGRACLACRKLKVKCDSAERGNAGCSRCQRLGMECVTARRITIAVDDNECAHPSIMRLNKAVEEVLQKLNMPALETYANLPDPDLPAERAMYAFQVSRENSREPTEDNDMAPAPMGSLYEVTQLNTLQSRLRKAQPKQRTSRRSMEQDLIAQNQISLEDAEEMFELFKMKLSRYLFAAIMPVDTQLSTVRESSTLLFTAIMLVGALHIPGKEAIHDICHKQFLELVAAAMFEKVHTLDDIRGLCIAAFWQADLSWKLSGLCIRIATELNLHQAFYSAFYTQNITEEQRNVALEKARIWYLLYILDHHFSIAYGRPPVTAELLPMKEYDVFMNSPWCTSSDRRLISQIPIFVTLSKAFEVFGLEAERRMATDDVSLLMHQQFMEDVGAWYEKWRAIVVPDQYIGEYPSKGVPLHYHFSSLVLNSLALRGRPLDSLSELPRPLRPIAFKAIEAAHRILEFFLDEPSYVDSFIGIPLYLHSMIAFAVVFLIKLSHRWHAIGITIDPETRTKPLIERMTTQLRLCKAGSNHMVYSMASGFERMLKTTWGKDAPPSPASNTYARQQQIQQANNLNPNTDSEIRFNSPNGTTQTSPTSFINTHPNGYPSQGPSAFSNTPPTSDTNYYEYQLLNSSSASSGMTYSNGCNVGLENDMLWSAGMGYDLLHTNRQDLTLSNLGLGLGLFGNAGSGEIGHR